MKRMHGTRAVGLCAWLWVSAVAVAGSPVVRADDPDPAAPAPVGADAPAADAQADIQQQGQSAQPAAEQAPADPAQPAPSTPPASSSLPDAHKPQVTLALDPAKSIKLGELVHLNISATVPVGDDVTIAQQSFAPFEVYKKQARVEAPNAGTQRFVFNLDLLALEPGETNVRPIELRVVTKDNQVGSVHTDSQPFTVQSLLANEPNAQPKLETAPVVVLENNYIPVYIASALLAIALVVVITLLVSRYLRRRQVAVAPLPPPRPPWDVAIERLAELKRKKPEMLATGEGALFVEELSHVVRDYLGGRYDFDGLETTTDEMLTQLKLHGASLGFTHEVGQFLGRSDLVKFAKATPDNDEVDLLFAKAQDLVHMSEPEPPKPKPEDGANVVNAAGSASSAFKSDADKAGRADAAARGRGSAV